MTNPPPCLRSSSMAAEAISYRAKDVSTIPLIFRPFVFGASEQRARCVGQDRFVCDPAGGRVPGDGDPQLVPELLRLAEEIEVTGMEEIEDPRRHYTDHKRHARTMSWPSRNTRFLARAYAFASSFERARPSSAIISQIVAVGARPAMIISAVVG